MECVVLLWNSYLPILSALSYTSDEIHFNLLAVVSDRIKLYMGQVQEAEARKNLAAQKV